MSETLSIREARPLIKQLAKEWGLTTGSTSAAQLSLMHEECEEALMELGDVLVCAINAQHLANTPEHVEIAHDMIDRVVGACMNLGLDPERAMYLAYNKIKARVGMIVGYKWTKWQDLDHDHRVYVAKSGQLNRDGVDVNSLLECCSDNERREILEIINA